MLCKSSYVAISFAFNQSTYAFKESDGELFIKIEKVDGQLTEVAYQVDLGINSTATNQDYALLPVNSTRDCCSDVARPPVYSQVISTCFEPDEEFIRIPIQIFQDEVVETSEYIYIDLIWYEKCMYGDILESCEIEIIDDDGKCSCM